jgi:hypothetical protein
VKVTGENYTIRSFVTYIPQPCLLWLSTGGRGPAISGLEVRKTYILLGKVQEKISLGNLYVCVIILKLICMECIKSGVDSTG